jgi:PAS domain S-box-containing protein
LERSDRFSRRATPISDPRVALIYAPEGRDSAVAASLLREAKVQSRIMATLHDLETHISEDTLFVVVVEEALRSSNLKPINGWVAAQPSWSDLPFIVLSHRGAGPERNPAAARIAEALGNATFLERPFHPTTFVSVVNSALRNRRRQYEARSRIEELHESELRLKTALQAGHLGTWQLDIEGRVLGSSPEFRQMFGHAGDDTFSFGQMAGAIHPGDRANLLSFISLTISTGEDFLTEFRTRWPDGSEHWVEMRGQLVRDREGRPMRVVGVSMDMTSRKRAEADLRRLNETLEQRVEERTRALREEANQRANAEAKLRQSQKLEAIGQLTGGIAHDFNNLLMAVLGNLDLLRKNLAGDPKSTRLIEGALQGARRGASLTQRLLAFARRQELEIVPTNLGDLVESMRDLITRSVGSIVEIRTRIPKELPRALADGNQVELALLNLVVNARDAMPDGGAIEISLRDVQDAKPAEDLPKGRYLCLSVADNGCGMDAETLQRAIDPFFSTKELGKGTGLGLSMIHGLALQHQGALKLKSEVGVGTTAELWLPATELDIEKPEETSAPAISVKSAATILIVDDDPLISMSTVDMVEDLGHHVLEANSGADALKILSSDAEIDLMISDYSMPGMNGAQLAIAARELRPRLPILLATGYADLPPGSNVELPRLGKPYSQEQLETEIGKVLNDML